MLEFNNSFFSWEGQKERLKNATDTLLSAVGLKEGGVQSNTGIKPLDTALGAAASHPFISAGVVAGGMALSGVTAPASFSSGVSSLGAVAVANPKVSLAAAVIAPVVLKSEKGREAVLDAPGSYNTFTSNVAGLIDNPSLEQAKKTFKDDPLLSSAAGAAIAIGAGVGIGGIASTLATMQNTASIKENTQTALESSIGSSIPSTKSAISQSSKALIPETSSNASASATPPVMTSSDAPESSLASEKGSVAPASVKQNTRVVIQNNQVVSKRKVFKVKNLRIQK